MLKDVTDGISSIYDNFLIYELNLAYSLQSNFNKLEPIFVFVSEELGPNILLGYVCPLLGVFNMNSMVKYLYTMGIISVSSNILKWIIHDDRPYWWCREKNLPSILQHHLTCETSSGIPSGHTASIVALSYLILICFGSSYRNLLYFPLIALCLLVILSRIYFGCHFLHQCVIGGLLAYILIKYIFNHSMWKFLLETGKKFHVTAVFCIGLTMLISYFVMIYTNIDPHWSVRMAFKWCHDPMYLIHMNSPVYSTLGNLGFMMGISLSAPLIKRTQIELKPYISVPLTICIMVINTILKNYTPTQKGRLAFVLYGFIRNLCFTLSLLTLLPKLAIKNYGKLSVKKFH